jgi:hypothetical protein
MEYSETISDMILDLNDVIKVLKHHPITKEMLGDYPSDSIFEVMFSESPKTLFDLPKDFEGTQFTIGDCLETVRDHVLQLQDGR